MEKKKKEKKTRAKTYEKPLKINATFEQAMEICMKNADKKVAEKQRKGE